jgi:hypothetical protein
VTTRKHTEIRDIAKEQSDLLIMAQQKVDKSIMNLSFTNEKRSGRQLIDIENSIKSGFINSTQDAKIRTELLGFYAKR